MPKLAFSKIRFSELKDLVQNVKRPKRLDIVLSRKTHKDVMVQKVTDEKHRSKLSRWSDHKLHPTLEKSLHNERYRTAFQTFLRSEFSDENMEFWLECQDFKSASADELPWKAEQIYRRFIQPAACREINVDHHIREEIKKSLSQPSVSCFNEAQKQVYLLMERDSWPRFLLSDAYLRLKIKSKTLWYI